MGEVTADALTGAVGVDGRGPWVGRTGRPLEMIVNEDRKVVAAVHKELTANPNSTAAASMLDILGQTGEAKRVFQKAIDAAADATTTT